MNEPTGFAPPTPEEEFRMRQHGRDALVMSCYGYIKALEQSGHPDPHVLVPAPDGSRMIVREFKGFPQ